MFNIFQGNDLIKNTIASSLGYDENQKYSSFTKDIYFQAFFYLSKRFGQPSCFDNYKEAGAWGFKVKNYIIEVRLNTCWVEFMIYGKIGNHKVHSPYSVKYRREWMKKRELLINEQGDWNKTETLLAETLFNEFLRNYQIDKSIKQEEFDRIYGMKWYEFICAYNKNIIDVDLEKTLQHYGNSYQNAYTRHALKTLNQFINNMLTPIWIRDVPYNIKGVIKDEQIRICERYFNNIIIEFIKQTP